MARPPGSKAEVELLQQGIDLRSVDKSAGASWIQNMLFRNGRAEVRKGFGTLARYSMTMTAGKLASIQPIQLEETPGYLNMLGAFWFITDDGHEQILTVHTANVFTANMVGTLTVANTPGTLSRVYCVNIYDITSDTRQEVVLARSTADTPQEDITKLYPIQQTDITVDRQTWVYGRDTTCSFTQLGDRVLIVLADVGVGVYLPGIPIRLGLSGPEGIPQALELAHGVDSGVRVQGECGFIQQLRPTDGEFAVDGVVYVSASEFPTPTCACTFNQRAVWASGRNILFSDPDRPNVIQADNFLVVPSEGEITAVQQQLDRLIITTEEELWLYTPPAESLEISGGRLFRFAYGIGCLSQNHICRINEMLVMVDRRGTYLFNRLQLDKQSDPVEPWWTQEEQAQNPYSNFVTQLGFTAWDDLQPRARIDIAGQLDKGKLTWSDYYGVMLLTLDDITLCLNPSTKTPTWQVWLYESASVLKAGVPVVGLVRHINQPWLLAAGNQLYMVSTETTTYGDGVEEVVDRHLHIAQYGRGGALDVSSSQYEDRRQPLGQYVAQLDVAPEFDTIWMDRPVLQPLPFTTQNQSVQEQVWLVPLSLQTSVTPCDEFWLRFRFDNTNWLPLLSGLGVGRIDYLIPPERLPGKDGYANTPGVSEVALYDSGTGVRSNTGDEVRVYWDGTLCPDFSAIGAGLSRATPVLYLPFVRRTGTETDTVLSMGVSLVSCVVGGFPANFIRWVESRAYPEQSLANDALAQPVDWVFKSRQMMVDDNQLKYRGMWLRMLSYGQAVTRIPGSAWVYGLVNTLVSADYQDFSGQIIDFVPPAGGELGNSTITRVQPLRERMQPPTSPVMFRRIGAQQARWGTNTDGSKGNFLVDDPQVDTIATSDSVRGEQFSVMLFGNTANPGEHVAIGSVKGTMQVVGGKRRAGRTGTV